MQDKYHFKFTLIALQDIDEAMKYISEDLANPLAASRLYEKLERAVDEICEFPYAYSDCSYYLIANENIRHIAVGNYVLIYEVVKEIKTVNVLRFCYAMMDLSKIKIK